jgi:hypothetical protein
MEERYIQHMDSPKIPLSLVEARSERLARLRVPAGLLLLAFSVSCLLFASGCRTNITPASAGVSYAPVPVDKVEVLYQEPQRPYMVIALVSYSGSRWGSVTKSIEHCREAAAKAGADAVLISATEAGWHTQTKASGKALKWK